MAVSTPRFSVIIPTWNRPHKLATCLRSFLALEYPAEAWELIVVNDGGTASFNAMTSHLRGKLPLQLVNVQHAGPAAARNAGARQACGDYLAFTDDDCRVASDWLQCFAACFGDGDWGALGGRTLNPFPDNGTARTGQRLIDFLYEYMNDEAGNALLLFSNNAAYRRPVFDALGGFDETFPWAAAEDLELSLRLLARGYRQRYCLDARVWHYHRPTWRRYAAQQFHYGRGAYFLRQARKRLESERQAAPRAKRSFYVPLAQSLWRSRAPLSMWLLIAVSQMAYHVGRVCQTLCSRLAARL